VGSPFTRAEILLGRDEDILWFEDSGSTFHPAARSKRSSGRKRVAMGIGAFFGKQESGDEKKTTERKLPMFLSAFAVGITNPAAILTFLFAFSYFDLSAGMNAYHGILLVCGVLFGTLLWWLAFSGVAARWYGSKVWHSNDKYHRGSFSIRGNWKPSSHGFRKN